MKKILLVIPKELNEKIEKYSEQNRVDGFKFNRTDFFLKAADEKIEKMKVENGK